MSGFTPVFVSHHQFQVLAGAETGDRLDLYTVGDRLLQLTGRRQVTVFTGLHTGRVQVGVTVRSSPPGDGMDGWEAAAEATVWCPEGQVAVCGLMGDCPPALTGLAVGRPGLLRVRVLARHRRPDGHEPDPDPPEQYLLYLWPVDDETGFRTLRTDDLPVSGWPPDRARAAGWAMLRLITAANPPRTELALRRAAARRGGADPPVGRVRVRRQRTVPAARAQDLLHHPADYLGATVDAGELVLPAGDMEIRLHPVVATDGFAASWRWAPRPGSTTGVPDPATSSVRLRARPVSDGDTADLVVIHSGVGEPDAVLLGLIWDYLLDRGLAVPGRGVPPHPWISILDDLAARGAAQAEAARRGRATIEARLWGGNPPSERLRGLHANAIGLSRLDRDLLDALADAAPQVQRSVARWAARQACTVAGLAEIDWIAPVLAALDRGEPLPSPFDTEQPAWSQLLSDRRIPTTTVTTPEGIPNYSQQALAFSAVHAAGGADPLAGAVDALYHAALAHGDHHRGFLAAAAGRLTQP